MHLAGQNVRGFDPVDGDKTPLHIAAANGHVELVRYLVDHAEVNLSAKNQLPRLQSGLERGCVGGTEKCRIAFCKLFSRALPTHFFT
jgi:ankyrin repeat protein